MCFTFWEMDTTPSSHRSSCLRIHAAIEATGPSHGPRSFKAPSLVMKDALKGMNGKSLIFLMENNNNNNNNNNNDGSFPMVVSFSC